MFDRFDDAHEEAVQTTLTNAQFDELPSGMIDLDLGGPFESAPLIELLAPSSADTRAGTATHMA